MRICSLWVWSLKLNFMFAMADVSSLCCFRFVIIGYLIDVSHMNNLKFHFVGRILSLPIFVIRNVKVLRDRELKPLPTWRLRDYSPQALEFPNWRSLHLLLHNLYHDVPPFLPSMLTWHFVCLYCCCVTCNIFCACITNQNMYPNVHLCLPYLIV